MLEMESLRDIFSEVMYINQYEKLLAEIFSVYLPGILTICRISGRPESILSDLKILPPIPTVSLDLNYNSKPEFVDNPLLRGIELGCNAFIVHQDSIISYLDQYIDRHDEANYRNPDKTLILLMDGSLPDESSFLEELSKHPNLVETMNLLILRPTGNMESIELWTHRFVGTVKEATDLLLLDIFVSANETFRYGEPLFPDKSTNLQGKAVRLATFHIPPHVILTESESRNPLVKSGNQLFEMDGVDGLLMVEFCRRYNCSVELITDEVNMWGKIDPNKTGNGILGNLAERRADVGFAALNNWHEIFQFLSFSKPIQRDSCTCLAPKPVLQPGWKVMLKAFSAYVWLSTIIVFFVIVSMHLSMDRINHTKLNPQNIAQSFLNLLAIFLLQSAKVRKRNVSDVILSVALLLFVFNLINIYTSRNASLRAVPIFEPSIDDNEDLARSGLTWLATHEAWAFSLLQSDNPNIVKIISKFQVKSPSELRKLADHGGVAFATARLNYGHLMIGDWITPENVRKYQIMKEDVYYDYEISMATKTWPLMEQFNTLTMRTAEARVRYYQELDVIFKSSDYYVQTGIINSRLREPNRPRTLNLIDLLGGFFILGMGLLIAMIVFLFEVFPIKSKQRNPGKLITENIEELEGDRDATVIE